jgi:hypothetical protein
MRTSAAVDGTPRGAGTASRRIIWPRNRDRLVHWQAVQRLAHGEALKQHRSVVSIGFDELDSAASVPEPQGAHLVGDAGARRCHAERKRFTATSYGYDDRVGPV